MRCSATVRVACADAATAQALLAALEPDNGLWIRGRVEGRTLVLDGDSDSPAGLRRTLDDVLACASAATKATALAGDGDA